MSRKHRGADSQRSGLTFAAIPHVVLASSAYRSLSLRARAVLIEIVARHNGHNNGAVGASQRDLATGLGTVNYGAIGRAVAELIAHGLLDIAAGEKRWERQAREYRLTWLPTGEPPHRRPPTNEWRAFSSDEAASAAKALSAETASAGGKVFAEAASARVRAKRQKSANPENGRC